MDGIKNFFQSLPLVDGIQMYLKTIETHVVSGDILSLLFLSKKWEDMWLKYLKKMQFYNIFRQARLSECFFNIHFVNICLFHVFIWRPIILNLSFLVIQCHITKMFVNHHTNFDSFQQKENYEPLILSKYFIFVSLRLCRMSKL